MDRAALWAAAAVFIGGCKFAEVPSIDAGPVDADGDVDASVDAPARGPLVVNHQPAERLFGQAEFTMSMSRGAVANGIDFPQQIAAHGNMLWTVDVEPQSRVLGFPALPPQDDPDAVIVVGRNTFIESGLVASPSATNIGSAGGVAATADVLVVSDFKFNRVLVWRPPPSSNGEAADLVLGQLSFGSSTAGAGAGQLANPTKVWTDGTILIVSDATNHRLLIWTQFPTVNGEPADLVLGQAAFGDSSQPVTPSASRLRSPGTVFWDGERLAVSDGGHNRVLVWSGFPTQNGEAADLVIGQPDFVTAGGEGSSPHRFNVPGGAAVVDGALFVTDLNNHRVLVFDPVPVTSLTNVSEADQVLGQTNPLEVMVQTTNATSFRGPVSLAVLGDDLFVAENGNHRIMRFDLALP